MQSLKCFALLCVCLTLGPAAGALQSPGGLVSRAGDKSVVLHWERSAEAGVKGYNIYRSISNGCACTLLNTKGLIGSAGYCAVSLGGSCGLSKYYQITA